MTTRIDSELADLLDSESRRINSPAFIGEDPVQFPRRFSRLQDIEITALLAAAIAWGKRTMICRDAERMLAIMNHEPYDFVMSGAYERIDPDRNIHRTMFGRDMKWLLRTLHYIYRRYGSLDAFAAGSRVGDSEAPAWDLVRLINEAGAEVNETPSCPRVLPANLRTTALKRVNMALRWLVRDDGIVDLGVWRSIPKSKLFIPLDVHVGNTARSLGLLNRKANDRKSVEQLTAVLRELDPGDPARFDFALFGLGIEARN